MKSDIKSGLGKDRFYLECDCESPSHVMVFEFYEDDHLKELSVYFASDWRQSLFSRLKMCFNFIFKKQSFMWTDAVMLNDSNIHQLKDIIKYIEKINVSK